MRYQRSRLRARRILASVLITVGFLYLSASGVSAHGTGELGARDVIPAAALGVALFIFLFSFILLAPADVLGLSQPENDDRIRWFEEERYRW